MLELSKNKELLLFDYLVIVNKGSKEYAPSMHQIQFIKYNELSNQVHELAIVMSKGNAW